MPTWSGTRKKLEEDYLCPALRGRIRYFATTYRKSHDREGRASILLDGKEILKSNYFDMEMAYRKTTREAAIENPEVTVREAYRIADPIVLNNGYFDQRGFYRAFEIFDNQSIEKSLEDENPLVRVFALLDRRTGKRRLLALRDKINDDRQWVKLFYDIRMKAEFASE